VTQRKKAIETIPFSELKERNFLGWVECDQTGEVLLIGDCNQLGGGCDHCSRLDPVNDRVHILYEVFRPEGPIPRPPQADERHSDAINETWRDKLWAYHKKIIKGRFKHSSSEDIRFLAMGLAGEVGEVLNVLKKHWRGDSKDIRSPELIIEIGDAQAYLAMLLHAIGMDSNALMWDIVRKVERKFKDKLKPEEDEDVDDEGFMDENGFYVEKRAKRNA
jgi:NTP pyrophosphatase (non-canonical NTP hydrolase)